MSFPKILAIIVFFLCAGIAYFSWSKNRPKDEMPNVSMDIAEVQIKQSPAKQQPLETIVPIVEANKIKLDSEELFDQKIDLVNYFFKTFPPQLPIVETIVYSSKVDWLKGRLAYIGDYAAHFQTSKHFISRSLKGKANYFSQNISNGDRFNVFRADKDIQFHLVVDLTRLKMRFYYLDVQANERVLLKTYQVSAGKLDEKKLSGSLTPIGQYQLGKEVAIYKEGVMGTFNNKPCEMITVFGNRWIPFEKEVGYCTSAAKGLGIHGMPWKHDEKTGQIVEIRDGISKFESSGCVRLLTEDIEEIFSIIITKPSFIHIAHSFEEAKIPGNEVKLEL